MANTDTIKKIKEVEINNQTYEIVPHRLTDGTHFANLPTLTKQENTLLLKENIINNLTSAATDLPLSAAQGKWLNDNKQPKGDYAYKYQLKDSYLSFGGQDISGRVSPVDMSINEYFSANRFAFLPGKYIDIEYSNDGGVTWKDYQASDQTKTQLVTDSTYLTIGKVGNTKPTTQDQLRITITAATGVLYTSLRKLHIRVSTNGAQGSKVKLETRTVARYNANEDIWAKVVESPVSGWSGWNVLNHNITFGGSKTQNGNNRQIRLTFSISGLSDKYTSNLSVYSIYGYGENAWSISNTFAERGHIYKFNMQQETFFPALIQSPGYKVENKDNTSLILAGGGTKPISDLMPKSGGTFTGPINFSDATALPSKELKYICGIDGFAESTKGQMGWQSKTNFLSGYATEKFVTDKGYLTQHQDISGKADKTYVDTELGKKLDLSPSAIRMKQCDNPFIKMQTTVTNSTPFYLQAVGNEMTLGTSYNKATKWDKDGNLKVEGNLTINNGKQVATISDIPDISGKVDKTYVDTELSKKQPNLVSGTNIKTINNTSVLGSGNISIPKGDKGEQGDPFFALDVNPTTGELYVTYAGQPVEQSNFELTSNGNLIYILDPVDPNSTRFDLGNIKGPKGDQGPRGFSVSEVKLTSGTTTSGSTAIYIIYNDNNHTAIGSFKVYNGKDATVSVGNTTTLAAGQKASVTQRGTASERIFDFAIPQGIKGDQGDPGVDSKISVGNTTTLAAGQKASVTQRGTPQDRIFDFAIPQGVKGDQGLRGYDIKIANSNYSYNYSDWQAYAATSYTRAWEVTSSSGFRVNDTVVLTGVVKDRNNSIAQLLGTVTGIPNGTSLTIRSAGFVCQGPKGDRGPQGPANVRLSEADTRGDNQIPSWYMTNYGKNIITEFKSCSTIGVNNILTGTYCNLTTIIPWGDKTGGMPVQFAVNSSTTGLGAYRTSNLDGSAWNAWSTLGAKGDKGDPGGKGQDGKTPSLSINSKGELIATFN